MRTLEEIRQEMADAASYYEYAKQAGVQAAMDRHEAVYGALAWVLEEPWKGSNEFEPKKTVMNVVITSYPLTEIEQTTWSDNSYTYRNRARAKEGDAWNDWREGKV